MGKRTRKNLNQLAQNRRKQIGHAERAEKIKNLQFSSGSRD